MGTSLKDHAALSPVPLCTGRLGGTCLVLAGSAFFAGEVTHPQPTIEGSKVETLYDMFLQPVWYPSHALLLASFGLFATVVLLLRARRTSISACAK